VRYESMEIWDAMKQVKYQRTLEDLKKVIRNSHGDMNEAISSALNMVCLAVHAQVGTFWFYSRFGDGLIRPRAGFGGVDISNQFLAPGEGIAGQVIESGLPTIIADCRRDPRWAAKVDSSTGFVTKTMLCVPMIADGQPFGCIQLINKTDDTLFDDKDMSFANALAEAIAEQFVTLNLLADGRVEPQVAVLFVDIRGFTQIAEEMDPAELAELLNAFLSFATGHIKANGGTADKYIGDCALAYWVASESCDTPAYAACRAAMDMVNDAARLQKNLLERFDQKLQFGIGISYGPAFVGNIGTSALTDHTVVGATVNTAAHLEAIAPAGKVYISRQVLEALGKKAKKASPVSSSKMKSREKRLDIFSLEVLDM